MKKRNQKAIYKRSASAARPTVMTWKNLLLTVFCSLVIAAGFFFAGLQHFRTIDLGIKNSNLRQEEDDLRAEKRRLILAKEIALSPVELARTARKLGFAELEESIVPNAFSNTRSAPAGQASQPKSEERPFIRTVDKEKRSDEKLIVRTASVKSPNERARKVTAVEKAGPTEKKAEVAADPIQRSRIVAVRENRSNQSSSTPGLE